MGLTQAEGSNVLFTYCFGNYFGNIFSFLADYFCA